MRRKWVNGLMGCTWCLGWWGLVGFPLQPVGFWTLLLEAFVCTPGIAGPGTMKVHVRGNFWESLKGRVLFGGEECKFQSLEPKMMEDKLFFEVEGWDEFRQIYAPLYWISRELLKSFATILLGIWCWSIHLHLQLDLKTVQKKKPLSRVAMGIFSFDNRKLKVRWLFIQFWLHETWVHSGSVPGGFGSMSGSSFGCKRKCLERGWGGH